MSFQYHMFGATIGTLVVQARVGGSWQTICHVVGQQTSPTRFARPPDHAKIGAGASNGRLAPTVPPVVAFARGYAAGAAVA